MKEVRSIIGVFLVAILMTVNVVWAGEDEKPLDNAQVIQLTKADLGDAVIIAKIKSTKEVKFDLTPDDLVKLKKSGVSGPVIAAMLDRSVSSAAPGTASAKGRGSSKVVLAAKEGTFDIKPIPGDFKTTFAFFGMRRYVQFSEITSKIRIKDHFPTLLLYFDRDPNKIWWLVKLIPWNDYKVRVLDLQSMGAFSGTISNSPVESCDVPYSAVEEKPGMWRITPKAELQPGEYGLFRWEGDNSNLITVSIPPSLSDFGVD